MAGGIKKWLARKLLKRLQKARVRIMLAVSGEISGLGHSLVRQPILYRGGVCGLKLGAGVVFGCPDSPWFYSGYTYLETRNPGAQISIGAGTVFNNSCTLIANTTSISIGKDCRIGFGFVCMDSDFHGLKPGERDMEGTRLPDAPVSIGDNVFIGSGVTVLKGRRIGDGSVIAAGSVVTRDVPPNCIAGGNPCRVIRQIEEERDEGVHT